MKMPESPDGRLLIEQPRCKICNKFCAGWSQVEKDYFCADCDPIGPVEMKDIFKELEEHIIFDLAFPSDMSKIN